MSEAAERVEAWRRAKRKAGYRPVLLWLPIEAKGELDSLAYSRQQDIAACVVDAIRALATSQGVRKPLRLDAHQYERLKEELAADLRARFAGQPPSAPTRDEQAPPPQPPRRAKTGGKRGIAPEVLAAICAEREKHPNASLKRFAQHLYDTGIYRSRKQYTGEAVPVNPGTLKVWLDTETRVAAGARQRVP
jgi:hypothetical protein